MSKKNIILLNIMLLLLIVVGCSNTKDNSTSSLNKELTLDEKIEDNTFGISNLKCSALNDYDIIDAKNNILLLSDGYAYTFVNKQDKLYSNNEQCKKVDENIKIAKFYEGSLIGNDNKIYNYINNELEEDDSYDYKRNSYADLLSDDEIRQLKIVEMNEEEYNKYKATEGYEGEQFVSYGYRKFIILKNDGNIYESIYSANYYYSKDMTKYKLKEEKVIYSSDVYGLINSFSTLITDSHTVIVNKIVSDKGYYELQEVKTDDCQKYEDIICEKKLMLNEKIDKYKKDIKYMNLNYIITNNNSIINIDMFEF